MGNTKYALKIDFALNPRREQNTSKGVMHSLEENIKCKRGNRYEDENLIQLALSDVQKRTIENTVINIRAPYTKAIS
jgi:hypothetical protein